MKYLIWLLLTCPLLAQLPDAPARVPTPNQMDPPTFWRVRTFEEEPLRTNRAEFHSKMFVISQGMMWAAVTTDILVTHGRRENAGSEIPAVAGVTGLNYLLDRFVGRPFVIGTTAYTIQHYVRDIFK